MLSPVTDELFDRLTFHRYGVTEILRKLSLGLLVRVVAWREASASSREESPVSIGRRAG